MLFELGRGGKHGSMVFDNRVSKQMTHEETLQVQTYINGLKAAHKAEVDTLSANYAKNLLSVHKAKNIAQNENMEMGQAVHQIRMLSKTHSGATTEQIMAFAKQIIERYCPDCDIPF